MRALWMSKEPWFIRTKAKGSWGLMQVPYFTMLNNKTVGELTYYSLSIQMHEPDDQQLIDQIVAELK